MNEGKKIFLAVTLGIHVMATLALVLLYFKTGIMTGFCVVAGALIGCVSVPARPGRPVSQYVAFGVLMGYVFWMGVSAVNQRDFLILVPVVLLAAGAAWWLQAPREPATVFTGIVVLLFLGLAVLQYQQPHHAGGFDPDRVRRSGVTSLGILGIGLVYLALGTAEALMRQPRKTKRARRRVMRPPAESGE